MKIGLTRFSKGVVYLIGLAALAVFVVLVPEIAREETIEDPTTAYLAYPFFTGAYLLAIPFFIALYQALKLIDYIEQGQAFSQASVKALKHIKYCAATIGILIVVGVVAGISLARGVDPAEDVTPLVSIGFVFTLASSVVATFAAVLERLLHDAIAIKSENDLTV